MVEKMESSSELQLLGSGSGHHDDKCSVHQVGFSPSITITTDGFQFYQNEPTAEGGPVAPSIPSIRDLLSVDSESDSFCNDKYLNLLIEDSDSEIDTSSTSCFDALSNMAELRLEQCGFDSSSIDSSVLGEHSINEDTNGSRSEDIGACVSEDTSDSAFAGSSSSDNTAGDKSGNMDSNISEDISGFASVNIADSANESIHCIASEVITDKMCEDIGGNEIVDSPVTISGDVVNTTNSKSDPNASAVTEVQSSVCDISDNLPVSSDCCEETQLVCYSSSEIPGDPCHESIANITDIGTSLSDDNLPNTDPIIVDEYIYSTVDKTKESCDISFIPVYEGGCSTKRESSNDLLLDSVAGSDEEILTIENVQNTIPETYAAVDTREDDAHSSGKELRVINHLGEICDSLDSVDCQHIKPDSSYLRCQVHDIDTNHMQSYSSVPCSLSCSNFFPIDSDTVSALDSNSVETYTVLSKPPRPVIQDPESFCISCSSCSSELRTGPRCQFVALGESVENISEATTGVMHDITETSSTCLEYQADTVTTLDNEDDSDDIEDDVSEKTLTMSNYEDVTFSNEPVYETINYDLVSDRKRKPGVDSRSSRSSRSSHSSSVSGPWTEERLYEDINDLNAPSSGSQGLTNDLEDVPWFSRRLQHRQLSSSDSWGSEDFESYSSNEEEEKPTNVAAENDNNKTANFKQRLLRKREQWRERRQSNRNLKLSMRKDSKEKDAAESAKDNEADTTAESVYNSENRMGLYRWFSLRKSNYSVERKTSSLCSNSDRSSNASYTVTNGTPPALLSNHLHSHLQTHHRMPRLLEEADQENGSMFSENRTMFDTTFQRRQLPPTLPPMPSGLSPEQIKRRHIVASIVHSENNYVATLHRLVNDYKKPLDESKPLILSHNKLNLLFHRVSEILQCHTLFRIALTECVRQWDKEEKIGEVFVATFSKAAVLDVYSGFINNFSRAMDIAKQESKKKSAFADFLKMRQITSSDRLSFFGLMVKPVQRFPQFILFLQDLLKHTPQGHHDRMSLQLALTQLESLAEMLNERKREAEQYQAFRDTLKHINTKFALKNLGDGNRYLLRQDNVTQLEFNQNGMINKTKDRRLFLTNDVVICVSVVPKSGDDFLQQSERLSLKWAYPVADVEITDTSSSPTLSRLLAAGLNKADSMSSRIAEESLGTNNVDSLVQEMNNLMHDYEVLSRISALVSTLKGSYEELSHSVVQKVGANIQRAIHQKDEQMVWVDACCLQFCIKTKDGKEKETITFQTDNPSIKKDWIVELRLAQLALDKNNSPAWDLPDHERTPSTKMPLFVKSLPVFSSKHQTEVKCGCCYTVTPNRPSRNAGRQMMYLWLCSSDGMSSHLSIFLMQQVGLRELIKVDLTEMCVSALQHVPALGTCISGGADDFPLRSHTVWMGTDSHRLLVYSGLEPEKQTLLSSASVPAAVTAVKYHCDQVFIGLSNGSVQVYRRGTDGSWLLNEPIEITLESNPICALLPISTHIYASCGNEIHVIDCFTAQVVKEFGVQHDDNKSVYLMAHSGIGLWIAQEQSSTICLYHTETFRHLQNINVASNVSRMLSETGNTHTPAKIYVTALIASKGLLWVGTNVGVALTIPLPRLEGVPIISGRANISYHAHIGPITFLLALQSQSGRPIFSPPPHDSRFSNQETANEGQQNHPDGRSSTVPPTQSARLEKQQSEGGLLPRKAPQPKLKQQLSSPVIRRRPREPRDQSRRISKTLPRGVGSLALSGSQECDVYGLCGALLNVHNYDEDSLGSTDCGSLSLSRYDSMRRSDPELALPSQLSTLDRRVRLKASRPRSLDLSTWSVDSRASSACTTTSSGSEESSGGRSPAFSKQQSQSSPTHNRNGTSKHKDCEQNRTLMVVMGGRGYINWQHSESQHITPVVPNTKDAHIVVWEMKL